ncbi:putative ABC transporter permease [Butyricicoccus porcorum]|uniref:ABC transporter permease n=1 Tax=Butyricicoccus porcorum TaxID=1945634 RepID=A0A252F7T7_9FIRM|nr:putative ABC transporter permease [Butyricicoccus porcorum]MCI6925702.1 hypothetical protein [Butyricicoccus porcorum]MDD6987810.1 hypothetical protein [Butyricicoccus porcorum]MDY4482656.1 hypothetical protein [Butyricicoccus porcorum]OUM21816.1 hypothetical protein CBW42_00910 [Butyricicoccus porcorum]
MHIYSLEQWMLLFYIYCFFGWCFESAYVSLLEHHWVNRGFLRAPLLPIYGSGALCILLVCLPVKENSFAVFVLGVVFPTLLEYITGYVMELLFKMRYWDYTGKKGNINGYICLQSSIAWGFLSLLLIHFIHPPIGRWVERLPHLALLIVVIVISCVFVSDVIVSFRAAFNLRHVLEEMERVRMQLEEARVQLELARAEARDRLEELGEDIREDNRRRQKAQEERAELLRLEFMRRLEHQNRYFNRAILKAHPSASSRRFAESMRQLRAELEKKNWKK